MREENLELQEEMVAVVTGAAGGIGFALCDAFASRGLRVVASDVEAPALDSAVVRLPAGRTIGVKADVSNLEDVRALHAETLREFGRVDILCNNAGVFTRFAPIWEIDIREWKWVIDVNLWGVIHGMHVFLPTFIGQSHGYVVNTASLAGVLSPPGNATYNAAKHGVVTLSEGLKAELDQAGIRGVGVTVVCPGLVDTRIQDARRNWPARFATDLADEAHTAASPAASNAISPAAAAEHVIRAIENDRLYCATHPGSADRASARFNRILEDFAAVQGV